MKKKNTFLRVGLVLTALVVGFIVLGLFWTPYSPNAMDFSRLLPPSAAHPMGTDKFGRDILSRVMVGAGDTLLIALGTVAIGTVVGTLVGALTGWYGGWVDEVLMRLNDALASFPSILILLVLVSLLGGGREHMTLALGIVFIPSYARIVRSEFARARTQNYVHSAELMGASTALGGNVLSDAFGVVAMVAMMPLLSIQVVGVLFEKHAKRSEANEEVYGDLDIIELWEEAI